MPSIQEILAAKAKVQEEEAAKLAAEQASGQSNQATGLQSSQQIYHSAADKVLADAELTAGMAKDPGTGETFRMPDAALLRTPGQTFVSQDGAETLAYLPPKKGPKGSFRAIRLKRFFTPEGVKIEPNAAGFYIPANEWEQKELEHFASQYELVEYQDGEEE